MLWTVVAPFFSDGDDRWIDDFVPGQKHVFRKVARSSSQNPSWHQRAKRTTPIGDWLRSWRQVARAVTTGDGVITLFPPLAAIAGLQTTLLPGRKKPVVAWCYNVGVLPRGYKQWLARFAMRNVDHIVVHSSDEIALISEWLNLPVARISFVPLQIGEISTEAVEERDAPFILAMGSADRDYATFFEALRIVEVPAIVVASERALVGLSIPPNVSIRQNLSLRDCRMLAQRACISVVPLKATPTASGQVTVVEAQRMSRPVIATRCVGTHDYIADKETGLLVEPGDPQALADAIQMLWRDEAMRRRLAENAGAFASDVLSDEQAARSLSAILDKVSDAADARH